MERSSNKHSPRVDEELASDVRSMVQGAPVEARAEDARLQEGGEGQETAARPDHDEGPPGQPDPAVLQERSELARNLRPSAFPGDKQALLATAAEENAPEDVVAALRRLPDGVEFPNVEAVWETLGGPAESRP